MGKYFSKEKKSKSYNWIKVKENRRRNGNDNNPNRNGDEASAMETIENWLQRLDMTEYIGLFENFVTVEDLLQFTEQDFKLCGIQNIDHRSKLFQSIKSIRNRTKSNRTHIETDMLPIRRADLRPNSELICNFNFPAFPNNDYSNQSKSLDFLDMNMSEKNGLAKDLENELNLDSRNIRSHAWYHGMLARQTAERLLTENQQFLVRDSSTSLNNYVLSCRFKDNFLHFIIKKVIIQPGTIYEQTQYQFEEDSFETVPDLITYYVGSEKPISAASMAIIKYPCNRLYSLSHQSNESKHLRSQSSNMLDTSGSGSWNRITRQPIEPDSGNCSYNSLIEPKRNPIKVQPDYEPICDHRSELINNLFDLETENEIAKFLANESKQFLDSIESQIDLNDCPHTIYARSTYNRPLDIPILDTIRNVLIETSPRLLAIYLTKIDSDLILAENSLNFCSNLDRVFQPDGHSLRLNLLERIECMRYFVAIVILMCSNELDRVEILRCWIELANELKIATGNLFGFSNIMLALTLPQIEQLTSTWNLLREKYTDQALNFESKLKPQLKSMNQQQNAQAPNTTVPHLLPLILINERDFSPEDYRRDTTATSDSTLKSIGLFNWETNSIGFGLETFYQHLNSTRTICNSLAIFRRNSQLILNDDCVRTDNNFDELILDIFRTGFHLRFLWGSRGVRAPAAERYAKFNQLLDILERKTKETE